MPTHKSLGMLGARHHGSWSLFTLLCRLTSHWPVEGLFCPQDQTEARLLWSSSYQLDQNFDPGLMLLTVT